MRRIIFAAVGIVQGKYFENIFNLTGKSEGVPTDREPNQLKDEIKCPENSDLNIFNQCICNRKSVR